MANSVAEPIDGGPRDGICPEHLRFFAAQI
jgi:hypothetical protein